MIDLIGIANDSNHDLTTIWLLATLGIRFTSSRIGRRSMDQISLPDACTTIMEDSLSLRKASSLMFGTVLVFKQRVERTYRDCSFVKMRMTRDMMMVRDSRRWKDETNHVNILNDDPNFDINAGLFARDYVEIDSGVEEVANSGNSGLVLLGSSSSELDSGSAEFTFNVSGGVATEEGGNEEMQAEELPVEAIERSLGEINVVEEVEEEPEDITEVNEERRIVSGRKLGMRRRKIQYDDEISLSGAELRSFQNNYVELRGQERARRKKVVVTTNFRSCLHEFTEQLLRRREEEGIRSQSRRSSSVSSVEHARRGSLASSVEQGRRGLVTSKNGSTPEHDFSFDMDQLGENGAEKDVLDFEFEGDDADIDISFGAGDVQEDSEVSRETRIRGLYESLLRSEILTFELLCPVEITEKKNAAETFQMILELASADMVGLELSEVVVGKNKWELLSGEEIMIECKSGR